jgi:hypothetical protein
VPPDLSALLRYRHQNQWIGQTNGILHRPPPGVHPPESFSVPRWRTFMRHHTGALLVRGMAADLLIRSVQAVCARLMRTLQPWRDRSVASGRPGTSTGAAMAMALLRDTRPARATWSLDTRESLSVVEQSPPDIRSPHTHDPCTATRATQVDTAGVCPAIASLDGWDRASPYARSTQSLRHGETQATPLQCVA